MYASALMNADKTMLSKFIELHNSTDLQEEKVRLAQALGAVKEKNLINEVLKFALSVY